MGWVEGARKMLHEKNQFEQVAAIDFSSIGTQGVTAASHAPHGHGPVYPGRYLMTFEV